MGVGVIRKPARNEAATDESGAAVSDYEAAETEKQNKIILAVAIALLVTGAAYVLIFKYQGVLYPPFAKGAGTALLFGVVAFPVVAWLLTIWRHHAGQARRAAAWPMVDGTIQASQVKGYEGDGVSLFLPSVRYSFSVDGVPYEGNTIRLGSGHWEVNETQHEHAAVLLAGLVPGSRVSVAHDPLNPRYNAIAPVRHAFEGKERLFKGLCIALVLAPVLVGVLVAWASF